MYFKEKLVVFLSLLFFAAQVNAQDTTSVKKPEAVKSAVKPYKDVITAKAITKVGMFTVHKIDDKYYFEIPDSLLKREILLTSRLIKTPPGSPKFGGELINEKTISFEKGNNNNIFLKVITLVGVADSTTAISKAVRNANTDPIAMVFDVKAFGNHSTVIDVTNFIKTDNAFYGFDAASKTSMRVGGMAADKSYLLAVNPYPINIETKMVRTYTLSAAGPEGASGGVTFEMSTSLMLMPKVPMQRRLSDARVGYFSNSFTVFSDDQQKVENKTFIVRHRLEPKDADIEKYKRGELVEPKKQIVYYTDPATPKQWRKYIIQGINDWQKAFEQAGFKNAIIGMEWPENDTTMNIDDARYNVVRYLPSMVANAYGRTIHDPRSGEILQSYVGWYHNIMRIFQSMYFVQAAGTDAGARKMKFDDDLMGELIRAAISHELGHTLGLRHNMGSSSQTPVEKLRDKTWVEANGHTVSIMDYARFNYVAQPEDKIGRAGILPRIGAYDKWAIQWGYKSSGVTNEVEDQKIVSKWVIDSLKANPKLWFGGEGKNGDPRAQAEDLGDNSMKAGGYGIKNLKRATANLLDWTSEEGDTYINALDIYDKIVGQYKTYADQAAANIGGVYETFKSVEQDGAVYAAVPKAKQKEAVAFIIKEYFQTPTWLLNPAFLNKFRKPSKSEFVTKTQEGVLNSLIGTNKLFALNLNTMRNGEANTYTLDEYLSDLETGLFSEVNTVKPIDIYRRRLEKAYISWWQLILGLVGKPITDPNAIDITNTDIPVVIRFHLTALESKLRRTMPLYKDDLTKAHLKYCADKIKSILKDGSTAESPAQAAK